MVTRDAAAFRARAEHGGSRCRVELPAMNVAAALSAADRPCPAASSVRIIKIDDARAAHRNRFSSPARARRAATAAGYVARRSWWRLDSLDNPSSTGAPRIRIPLCRPYRVRFASLNAAAIRVRRTGWRTHRPTLRKPSKHAGLDSRSLGRSRRGNRRRQPVPGSQLCSGRCPWPLASVLTLTGTEQSFGLTTSAQATGRCPS